MHWSSYEEYHEFSQAFWVALDLALADGKWHAIEAMYPLVGLSYDSRTDHISFNWLVRAFGVHHGIERGTNGRIRKSVSPDVVFARTPSESN